MRTVRLLLFFLPLLAVAPVLAPADEQPPAKNALPASITQALATYYNAVAQVKDLACDAKLSRTTDSGTSVVDGRFYWKSPDRSRFVPQKGTAENDPGAEVAQRDVLPALALEEFISIFGPCDWTETMDGDATKLEGKAKESGETLATVTLWIDAAHRITRLLAVGKEDGKTEQMETTFSCEEKGGKRLLTGLTARKGGEAVSMRWEYAPVGDLLLVSKLTSEVAEKDGKTARSVDCSGYKVDGGIDDSIFGGK